MKFDEDQAPKATDDLYRPAGEPMSIWSSLSLPGWPLLSGRSDWPSAGFPF